MFEGKNIMINNIDEIGDHHIGSSTKTPLRKDAFDISDQEKINRIQESVKDILLTLGMDLEDEDNIAGKGALQGEMKYFNIHFLQKTNPKFLVLQQKNFK